MNCLTFFRSLIQTEDGLVLYALSLIVIMEIVDFASGTFAAIANPEIEYKSKIGINGLIRKILGVLLLMVLIPMSVLLPEKTGVRISILNLPRIFAFHTPVTHRKLP